MRFSGVLILGFSVAFFGFYFTYRLIIKSQQLKSIELMINSIEQSIKYKKIPLIKIFAELSTNDSFSFLFGEFLSEDNIDIENMCLKNKHLFVDEFQKKSLYEFFTGLGKSDLIGQVNHCEIYKKYFTEYIKSTDKENEKKIKLYPSLFILFGMLIVIVLF